MTKTTHPSVDEYLRQLERAARSLPRRQREELLAEIRNHLDAALHSDSTEAEVRNVLDDLGSPLGIVAAARPNHPPTTRGAREVFALLLLLVGPMIFGWLVGVGLLLWSPLWSARQKLLGILVWPGGLSSILLLMLGASSRSSSTPAGVGVALLVVLLAAPILVAAYLYRSAGRQAEAL